MFTYHRSTLQTTTATISPLHPPRQLAPPRVLQVCHMQHFPKPCLHSLCLSYNQFVSLLEMKLQIKLFYYIWNINGKVILEERKILEQHFAAAVFLSTCLDCKWAFCPQTHSWSALCCSWFDTARQSLLDSCWHSVLQVLLSGQDLLARQPSHLLMKVDYIHL